MSGSQTEKRAAAAENGGMRRHTAIRSLNLILWLVFSAFAVAVILVSLVFQNFFAGRNFRSAAYETLHTARERIEEVLAAEGAEDAGLAAVAYELGVSAYLVYEGYGGEDGGTAVTLSGVERTYRELAEICGLLEDGEGEQFFSGDGEVACVSSVVYGGRPACLCLFASLKPLEEYESTFRRISLITGLTAVVLGFAVSGFVAMLVTRPVAEVTDRAKALARGDYSLRFRKDYFCSEIEELSSALEYARSEISKADDLQKELIANVSHDFKTPLTMIKAYASMILEITGDDKKKREQNAQVIIDEADRLAMLVSDVLDLSKLRAGVEEERERFELSEETRAIIGRFGYLAETQGYRFETEIEEGIFITAARGRIGQVVYNLIGNAVNYTGEDKRVRVKLFRKEGAARLEVIDSGKGIPPEELDTIWDRYYRSENSHKRPVQGTGLGLSIVKGVLLAHGFPFGAVSEQGKGSCFWVEFPGETPPEPPKNPQKRKKEGNKHADQSA